MDTNRGLRLTIRKMNREIGLLRGEVTDLEFRCAAYEDDKRKLALDLENANETIECLSKCKEVLRNENDSLREKNTRLSRNVERLTRELLVPKPKPLKVSHCVIDTNIKK